MAVVDPEHWFLPADNLPRSPGYTRGNTVVPLIDGKDYMAEFKRAVEACDRQLLLAGWEFSGEQRLETTVEDGKVTGRTLAEAVTAAARRGCDVRALIFMVPSSSLPSHFRRLHAPSNLEFARSVNAAGGEAILDARLARTATISSHHQKMVVTVASDPDKTMAFVGGIDLALDRWDAQAHASPPERQQVATAAWHDIQAKVQGPAVTQLWQAFRSRWNDPRQPNHLPALADLRGRTRMDAAPPETKTPGRQAVQVHQTLPAGMFPEAGGPGESSVAQSHVRAIERAEHLIYIEDQYVWPCALVDPLEDALERGVHVVMVVAREDVNWAARPTSNRLRHEVVERLLKAGGDRFHIFHLEQPFGEREQIYVHAKLMIVDDCYASIGSANFNGRSMTNDTEIEIGVVDEDLVQTTIDGQPAQVCRFAHELRCRLWSEHFEQPADAFRDPIRSLPRLWPEGGDDSPNRRAQPHHVNVGPLSLDPIAEHITTFITDNLIDVPCIDLPPSISERAAVKLLVNAALRGPRRAVLTRLVEESFNPSLAPVLNEIGNPVTSAWRRHWARSAAYAARLIGRRSPVQAAEMNGQTFVESHNDVQIFRLADGRYHVVSHFAVPSLESARNAAIAISGETE